MTQTHKTLIAAMGLSLTATFAQADCLVEYKAKQDNPLRLEHGTLTVAAPCTLDVATTNATAVLAERGWTLLKVLSVSPE